MTLEIDHMWKRTWMHSDVSRDIDCPTLHCENEVLQVSYY